MDTAALKKAIEQVFGEWERFPGPLSQFTIVPVMDEPHDRYLLQMVTKGKGLQASRTLAHLEIRDGKIRVESDGTERGITTELLAAGVPRSQIVVAFYPPAQWEEAEAAAV